MKLILLSGLEVREIEIHGKVSEGKQLLRLMSRGKT